MKAEGVRRENVWQVRKGKSSQEGRKGRGRGGGQAKIIRRVQEARERETEREKQK